MMRLTASKHFLLVSIYWQIAVDDREQAALITPDGWYLDQCY